MACLPILPILSSDGESDRQTLRGVIVRFLPHPNFHFGIEMSYLTPLDYLSAQHKTFPNQLAISDTKTALSHDEFRWVRRRIARAVCDRFDTSSRQVSVAILLDRGTYYLASMFAAWELGGYFIPLNLSWPADRSAQLIDQCQADVVICHRDGKYQGANALYIEDLELDDPVGDEPTSDVELPSRRRLPSDIAYVIYTSGSTGLPKGVMITNESYVSYIEWTKRFFGNYHSNQRLLITAELTFDITMGDIAFSLAFGTSIFVAPDNRNILAILQIIIKNDIDTFYSVPSTHQMLFQFLEHKPELSLPCLNLILSGGDHFSASLIESIHNVVPKAHFYNVYGPTEVTINCFAVRVDDKLETIRDQGRLPIGNPFDNIDAVVIDESGQAVTSEEIPGRLCVTGPQVMAGYFNDPDTTRNAFVSDPRCPALNRKLYDTGDLAVYGADGLVYLQGRTDDLVKIKGYRIHPNEVTSVLSEIDAVSAATTIAADDSRGKTCLVSFVTLSTTDLSEARFVENELNDIRAKLAGLLPNYMLPAEIHALDEMPLNNSGKIDKLALKRNYEQKDQLSCL